MRPIDADALIDGLVSLRPDCWCETIDRDVAIAEINDAATISANTDGRIGIIDNVIDRAHESLAAEATSWKCVTNGATFRVTVVAEEIVEGDDETY